MVWKDFNEHMTEKKHVWQIWDNLAFARSFHSLRMAISPARMVLALCLVVSITLIGWVMDLVVAPARLHEVRTEEAVSFRSAEELRYLAANPKQALVQIEHYRHDQRFRGVFSTLWHWGAARFNTATIALFRLQIAEMLDNIWLCALAVVWALRFHPVYSGIYFILAGMVTCVCGGAICRTAALEFGRGEKPGLGEGLRFALTKFRGLISAPLMLAGVTACLAACVIVVGLIGNIPYGGEIFIALSLGVTLVFGLLTLLFLIGSVAGASLIFPVIAYEGSDGHDAIARSFCYVYTRPWWMLFYTVLAAAFGTLSYLFVRAFAFGVLITTYLLLELGVASEAADAGKLARIWGRPDFFILIGPNAGPSCPTESIAAFVIYATMLLVVGLVAAFVVSFYFCASTILYALMRRKVDQVDMGRVYTALDHVAGPPAPQHDAEPAADEDAAVKDGS
ncbi:MAG: hypothetical protein IH624_19775 [Phycisphaerae bacterium]|nr:hypothetical protein [Phycisphaerae bacterium]